MEKMERKNVIRKIAESNLQVWFANRLIKSLDKEPSEYNLAVYQMTTMCHNSKERK